MKLKNQNGFTLIEVMIVIGIIAIGYGAVIFFGFGNKGALRNESRFLISQIRFLYQLASTENRYYRLVLNLDENRYAFESSDDPIFARAKTPDDEAEKKTEQQKQDNSEDTSTQSETSQFEESDQDLLEPYALSQDVRICSFFVEHQKEAIEKGQGVLHFFPRGQTQFAVIQLCDEEREKYMTLVVNPTTADIELIDGQKNYDVILEELKE